MTPHAHRRHFALTTSGSSRPPLGRSLSAWPPEKRSTTPTGSSIEPRNTASRDRFVPPPRGCLRCHAHMHACACACAGMCVLVYTCIVRRTCDVGVFGGMTMSLCVLKQGNFALVANALLEPMCSAARRFHHIGWVYSKSPLVTSRIICPPHFCYSRNISATYPTPTQTSTTRRASTATKPFFDKDQSPTKTSPLLSRTYFSYSTFSVTRGYFLVHLSCS